MSDHSPKRKLIEPWRSVHVVIWLVGLYILATRGWWWPGILVLVGISALFDGLMQRFMPDAYQSEAPVVTSKPGEMKPGIPATVAAPAPEQEHRLELLPQSCPNCSAPIRGYQVRWTGVQSANCPYCGTNLPMNKA